MLKRVSKSYAGDLPPEHDARAGDVTWSATRAVDDISITLESGTRLGIVGRNGAGKSTLLHLIAGLSEPTSGVVTVDGKINTIMTLGVGLREEASGRENIYLDGEIHGRERAEVDADIAKIIEFADLGEFIEYPVKTYSTGMKARLAFAMISHLEPEILIIDEALSVGDAWFANKATARIRDICARGKIVILVSHSMGSICDICNRAIWLQDGKLVMDGAPTDVTAAYIEAVRSEDEQELLRKFKEHTGSQSFATGCRVDRPVISVGNETEGRAVVESGSAVRIEINARTPAPEDSVIVVEIVRLDDQCLFRHKFETALFASEGRVSFEIVMDPLLLGQAIYRLEAALFTRDMRAAVGSTIFEVTTLRPPSGGKPMILNRCAARFLRIGEA